MYEDIIELIERAKGKVAFPPFGNGVSQTTIDRAETALGFVLPPSYKWWLLNYGGGQVGGDIVYGLDVEDMGRPDIVEQAHINERNGLYGKDRLELYEGNEESFLFDMQSRDENGEFGVLYYDSDRGEEEPYAGSFADFLRRRIKEKYRL
jgi:antitoxin YobK